MTTTMNPTTTITNPTPVPELDDYEDDELDDLFERLIGNNDNNQHPEEDA